MKPKPNSVKASASGEKSKGRGLCRGRKKPKVFEYWAIAFAGRKGDPFFCDFTLRGYPVPIFDTLVRAQTYMKSQSAHWPKGWEIVAITLEAK